jgi:hypothetical protein
MKNTLKGKMLYLDLDQKHVMTLINGTFRNHIPNKSDLERISYLTYDIWNYRTSYNTGYLTLNNKPFLCISKKDDLK